MNIDAAYPLRLIVDKSRSQPRNQPVNCRVVDSAQPAEWIAQYPMAQWSAIRKRSTWMCSRQLVEVPHPLQTTEKLASRRSDHISYKETSGQREFTSTSRAFLVNLTAPCPTSGLCPSIWRYFRECAPRPAQIRTEHLFLAQQNRRIE